MTQVFGQYWMLSWLLAVVVGCSSPAATPKSTRDKRIEPRVESELGKLLAADSEPRPGLASYGPELIYRLRARAAGP